MLDDITGTRFQASFYFTVTTVELHGQPVQQRKVALQVHREWLHDMRRGGVLVDDASIVQHTSGVWRAALDGRADADPLATVAVVKRAYDAATLGLGADPLKFVTVGTC